MVNVKEIICMREPALVQFIVGFLIENKIPYLQTKDYIVTTRYMHKTVPLICTHTDVISYNPTMVDFIINDKGVLSTFSPFKCLGADDRAGVWIALKMLEQGTETEFEYAFFADEERGAIGSSAFDLNEDLTRFSCFIGLDRASKQGIQNVAVYGYDNDELTEIFTNLGFVKQYGTFSDCSNLAEATRGNTRACVNLSVGYQHEHSVSEILNLDLLEDTLDIMLAVSIPEKIYDYVYTPRVWRSWGGGYVSRNNWERGIGTSVYEEEAWYTELGIEDDDDWDAEDDPDILDAVVCDFCESHEPLYHYQGSCICKGCLILVRN